VQAVLFFFLNRTLPGSNALWLLAAGVSSCLFLHDNGDVRVGEKEDRKVEFLLGIIPA
jgi:hypothetical protein